MTKYTRREFFKSIIPMGVGVVSFLGSDNLNKSLELDQGDLRGVGINTNTPTAYLNLDFDNEDSVSLRAESHFLAGEITLNTDGLTYLEDDTRVHLRQFFNQEKGVFYQILKDK